MYFDIANIIRSVVEIGCDFYMFPSFLYTYFYLVREKKEGLYEEKGEEFSRLNKCVIAYTAVCWTLNAIASVSSIFIFSYYFSSLNLRTISEREEILFIFFMRTFSWTVNFLTYMGMLYLFNY